MAVPEGQGSKVLAAAPGTPPHLPLFARSRHCRSVCDGRAAALQNGSVIRPVRMFGVVEVHGAVTFLGKGEPSPRERNLAGW
jgi:hypothetical protein